MRRDDAMSAVNDYLERALTTLPSIKRMPRQRRVNPDAHGVTNDPARDAFPAWAP
jgi:hypothetical protein